MSRTGKASKTEQETGKVARLRGTASFQDSGIQSIEASEGWSSGTGRASSHVD